jgi:acyl-CoA thioester hydrolase
VAATARYRGHVRLDVEPSVVASSYPFSHPIRVRFAETDAMGIVHHSRYLLYFEEARVAYLRHLGRPYSEMRKDGIEHAVLETFVQYRRPLQFDDVMDVHVRLAKATRASFQLAYLITVDDEVRATGVTAHGCINRSGRPVRMPDWLAELAAAG